MLETEMQWTMYAELYVVLLYDQRLADGLCQLPFDASHAS